MYPLSSKVLESGIIILCILRQGVNNHLSRSPNKGSLNVSRISRTESTITRRDLIHTPQDHSSIILSILEDDTYNPKSTILDSGYSFSRKLNYNIRQSHIAKTSLSVCYFCLCYNIHLFNEIILILRLRYILRKV